MIVFIFLFFLPQTGIFSAIPKAKALGEATRREGELVIAIFAWDMQL
jgi:hypothetical protein